MNKNSKIVITLVIVLLILAGLTTCLESGKKEQDATYPTEVEPVHTTEVSATLVVDETIISETQVEETNPVKETFEQECIVVESTPDSVKLEIPGEEENQTVHIQFGVDTDAVMSDGEEGQSGTQSQSPKPAEPAPPLPKPTEPKPTEPKPTQPPVGGTKVEEPGSDVTFEDYESMSGEEQMMFYYTFADAEAFNAWYDAAKAEYDANKGEIIIGEDGVVNLG